MEELWQGMIRAGWPGKHVTESEEVDAAPKDFVVMDPEAVPWQWKVGVKKSHDWLLEMEWKTGGSL